MRWMDGMGWDGMDEMDEMDGLEINVYIYINIYI